MQTYNCDEADARAMIGGFLQTPNQPFPHHEPTGVTTDKGTTYAALYNADGMLAVYRLGRLHKWRRVEWAKVPVYVLKALEGTAGPAPEAYRVWEDA